MGISEICQSIKNFFETERPPVQQLPRPLLACSLMKRPGLSTIVSVANIVKDLNAMGIPTGANPDGSTNLTVAVTYAIIKETFRALKLDAVVQVGTAPGAADIMVGNMWGKMVNCFNETTNGQVV